MQPVVVISYRPIGTTHRSLLQRSRIRKKAVQFSCTLRGNPEITQLTACSRVFLQKLPVSQLFKQFPVFLRTPTVRRHVHSSLPLVAVLSQMKPICSLSSYCCNISTNIILLPVSRSSKWFFPFCPPKPYMHLSICLLPTCLAHFMFLGLKNRIVLHFKVLCSQSSSHFLHLWPSAPWACVQCRVTLQKCQLVCFRISEQFLWKSVGLDGRLRYVWFTAGLWSVCCVSCSCVQEKSAIRDVASTLLVSK